MRKTHKSKTGALAAKQGAILFLCLLIIVACSFGIWRILGAPAGNMHISTPSDAIPTPEPTESALNAAPTAALESTADPVPTAEPIPSVVPTPEIVFADPLVREQMKNPVPVEGEYVTLPFSGLVIGIDPGHQAKGNSEQEPVAPGSSETKAKVSSGTQGRASGVPEYVTNLEVSLKLRDELLALGAEVHMSRTVNDVDISNIERALMFNEANADVVLRIHCNGSSNDAAEGIGLYVTATGSIAEESYAIAEVILDAMVAETGADKDGVFRRDTYSGLNWSEVPSMIVEMGFMSNKEEDLKLQDPEYQQKLIDGMIKGLAEYYGRDLPAE